MDNEFRREDLPAVRTARAALFVCFFLSGLTGLLYEIVWVRLFTVVFGNTVYSTSVVLGAFMGGLGVGGWWFGRFIEKRRDAVLIYGIVELVIGVYALVPPLLIRVLEGLYPSIYSAVNGSLTGLIAAKAAAAILVLALPAFCMGATLPLLSRFFITQQTRFGNAVSVLYGLNTLGAVLGAFLTGFILLRVMGIHTTLLLGMITNIGIALMAMVQHRKLSDIEAAEPKAVSATEEIEEAKGAPSGFNFLVSLIFCGTFMAGFVSMLLQVSWTRSLALILGSSVYAFTLILMTFLLGIALGSFFMGRYFKRSPHSAAGHGLSILGFCFICIAATTAAGMPLMQNSVLGFAKILNIIKSNYYSVLVLQFAVCVIILLAPTLFFGAAFPAAAALFNRRTNAVSSGVGRVYFWNTFGAILGSMLTGFLFIPLLGVNVTLVAGIYLSLAAGVLLMLAEGRTRIAARFIFAAAASLFVFFISSPSQWDRDLMSSGPFIYSEYSFRKATSARHLKQLLKGEKILYYHDGVSCTVTVLQSGESRYLRVNGKTDASTAGDKSTQIFLSAMPMLMHGSAKDIAVIGMGSGMTAGVALQFPGAKSLDLVEIEPSVFKAAKYFDDYNFKVREDPRMKIHFEDGRNFMLTHKKKYDVIVSEPSNHWIAGVASLYTSNFFKLASSRLNKGGYYCQWIQLYSIEPKTLLTILRTLRSVFPYTHVYLVGGDLIVVSSNDRPGVDAKELARRFDEFGFVRKFGPVGSRFDRLGISIGHYIAGPDELKMITGTGEINTDDRPSVEFAAPFELYSNSGYARKILLESYPVDVFSRLGIDGAKLNAGDYLGIVRDMMVFTSSGAAIETYLAKALELGPRRIDTLEALIAYNNSSGRVLLEDKYYRMALDAGARPALRFNYIGFLLKQNMFDRARDEMALLPEKEKSGPAYYNTLAVILEGNGDYAGAADAYVLSARSVKDQKARAFEFLRAALALKKTGKAAEPAALGYLEAAYILFPENASIAVAFAKSLKDAGRLPDAYKVLVKINKINPSIFEVKLLIAQLEDIARSAQQK